MPKPSHEHSDSCCPDEADLKKALESALETVLKVEFLTKQDRHISGWASVEVLDRQGELVSIDAFSDDSIKWFVENTPHIHLEHSDIPLGKVTVLEKRSRDGRPGLWVEADFYSKYTIHDEVWKAIESGAIKGFSFRGRALEKERRCDASVCYAYVPAVELYGISIVPRPANPLATIETPIASGFSTKAIPRISMASILTKADEDKEKKPPEKTEEKKPEVEGPEVPVEPQGPKYVTMEMFQELVEAVKKLQPGTQQAAQQAAAAAQAIEEKKPEPTVAPPQPQEEMKTMRKELDDLKKRAASTSRAPTISNVPTSSPLVANVKKAIQEAYTGQNFWPTLGFRHLHSKPRVDGPASEKEGEKLRR